MQNTVPRPEFPRPDFVREDWLCLNGKWSFSFDEAAFDRVITVPFCYQSVLSGIAETTDHNVVWYRRSFPADMERLSAGKCLLLKFGAVDTRADVWLNGKYLGSHVGGYTPFSFDITALAADENVLIVRAEDYASTDKPRGKQSWIGHPFSCWYTPVTGIWQSVWLEYTGSIYLERVKLTPDVERLEALCELFISGNDIVRAEVTAGIHGQELCRQEIFCRQGYGKAIFAFPDCDIRPGELLWTPEHPNLIDVSITLHPDCRQADQVHTYFGMRSVACIGRQIVLNYENCYQRLILDQGYWPDSLLTPPSDEAIQQDIQLTKQMGFNGVRKHQKIEDPRYYYWADKMGLLVWGELPSAYLFNDRAIHNSAHALMEFVERDYNHPCIITWVPINESWGTRNIAADRQQQSYCRMLTSLLKALDRIRLVSSNDGWEQISETDICALHDYALFPETIGKYEDMDRRLRACAEARLAFAHGNQWSEQPVMITEYGGIAFEGEKGDGSWGYYGRVKDQESFLSRLVPVTKYLIRSGQFAGFCYTQLTDVMQEVNGLLTERRQLKIPAKELYAIFAWRVC